MAEAVDFEAYALLTADELATELAAVNAEMTRQRLAGANFGTGSRNRGGVPYNILLNQKLAIVKAMHVQTAGVVDMTEADLS